MTTTNTPRTLRQRLMEMRLPDLQAHYREVVGEATRCPNRAWLVRRIEETLADRKNPPAKSQKHAPIKPAKGAKLAKGRPQAKEPEQAPSKPVKPTKAAKGRPQAKKEAQPAEAPAPEASTPATHEVPQGIPPAPETSAPSADEVLQGSPPAPEASAPTMEETPQNITSDAEASATTADEVPQDITLSSEASPPTADEAPQDTTPAPASPKPQHEVAEGASAAPESAPAEQAPAEPASSEAPPPAKPPRGRFSTMTVEQLQAKYLEVVGRPTGSSDRGYLIWKIREAEKGRIPVGPRPVRQSEGEPSDMKVLPLRLEGQVVEKLDEAWRSRGMKSRTEFIRRALAHYLTHLGADEVAALFSADAAQA